MWQNKFQSPVCFLPPAIWFDPVGQVFFWSKSVLAIKMADWTAIIQVDQLHIGCMGKWSRDKGKTKKNIFPSLQTHQSDKKKKHTSSLMCSTCSSRNSFLSVSDLFFFKSDWPIRAANSKSRSFCEALGKESKYIFVFILWRNRRKKQLFKAVKSLFHFCKVGLFVFFC